MPYVLPTYVCTCVCIILKSNHNFASWKNLFSATTNIFPPFFLCLTMTFFQCFTALTHENTSAFSWHVSKCLEDNSVVGVVASLAIKMKIKRFNMAGNKQAA